MRQIIVEKNVDGIEGLCVITPAVHGDSRGYSWKRITSETWKNSVSILLLFRTTSP